MPRVDAVSIFYLEQIDSIETVYVRFLMNRFAESLIFLIYERITASFL